MDGLSKAGYLDEARAIFRELQEKRVKSGNFHLAAASLLVHLYPDQLFYHCWLG